MRAPLSWLREYVETAATPAEIAQRLTVSSVEVERVTLVGVAELQAVGVRVRLGRDDAPDDEVAEVALRIGDAHVDHPLDLE